MLRLAQLNKRVVIILGLFAVTLSLLISHIQHDDAELIVNKANINLNKRGERVYKGQLFSGVAMTYFANGQLASAEQFKEGRREGFVRKWFEDGAMAFESQHQSGFREGWVKSWWYNGKRRSQMFFVNGKAQGIAWNWYRNGKRFKKFNFVNGVPQGLQQAWRQNGKLFSNFEYKNGRVYGLRKANNCVGLEDEVLSPSYYKHQSEGQVINVI